MRYDNSLFAKLNTMQLEFVMRANIVMNVGSCVNTVTYLFMSRVHCNSI